MKVIVSLFILINACFTVSFAQTGSKGKIFISKTLEFLQLINDSTILTSIAAESDTTKYYIKDNTLFIKNEYWQRGAQGKTSHIIKWENFTIVGKSEDSLILLNEFNGYIKPHDWEDTLQFVSHAKLKEPVVSFQYLKVDYYGPFDGMLKLTIDSLRKVTCEKTRVSMNESKVVTKITGELTKNEFARFLDTLSWSIPAKLRELRDCAIDDATINFEIAYNGKKIISKGCSLNWVHTILFNYLYYLNRNKGLRNITPRM